MTDVYACSFKSALTLEQMLARLNEVGPWRWITRDNDTWGEYLVTRALPEPHHGIVKIISEPGHYVVNVLLRSDETDAEASFEGARETVANRVLPAIGARDLAPTGDYD